MSWHLLSWPSMLALTGLGRPLLRPPHTWVRPYEYLVSTIAKESLRHDIRISIPLEVLIRQFRLLDTLPPRIPMSSDASLDTQLATPHLESSMRKKTNEVDLQAQLDQLRVDMTKVQEHNNQLHVQNTDLKEDYRRLTSKREEAQQ
ncbi:Hypothetical predicted protein [Prunus dulcis]|uniref:Uncharacterized protein n=1 Tax=Prunus dulcis TaxID=3755 RepID=A0A5E4FBL2_PRUDU|nr:Hypothetical predicted protein [Prunus dulcis]